MPGTYFHARHLLLYPAPVSMPGAYFYAHFRLPLPPPICTATHHLLALTLAHA
jgi:hypothetical protein